MHDQGVENAAIPHCRDIRRHNITFTFGSSFRKHLLTLHFYRGAVLIYICKYIRILMALYKMTYQFKESEAKHTFIRLKRLILLTHS